jgi:hypothetical protein
MSILCIATEDDDGNSAVEKGGPVAPAKKAAPKINVEKVMEAGKAAATNGTEALRSWYKNLSNEERGAIGAEELNDLKAFAAKPVNTEDK